MSNTDVMSSEAAGRYAKALLELAQEAKSLNTIEKDVKKLTKIFSDSDAVRKMATNPVYATVDKKNALVALAKKAKVSKLTTQFIGTVAENRRAAEIPAMLQSFTELLAKHRGTQIAKVTSATKMTAADITALKSKLKKETGRAVAVETTIDPSLIGGFVVQLGSRLYDNSLKTKLEGLRIALKDA
ncbi:F0F1 ATP synthase subunit delta [Fretibacter rubidus]|uniref:F0F1 ATP synthase subunit delta n=1 Tax=Fretibacter rubidus TaxID=570162 RepID=UPI00352A1D3C